MVSFSWNNADKETNIENIAYGKTFKFLIPKEFGGGFIEDNYQDYGYLGTKKDGTPKYDMYELLAFWNYFDQESKNTILRYKGKYPVMKEIDIDTNYNRDIGINIGCYDKDIEQLKYPLKLVSISCKLSYEEVDMPSYGVPDQGFFPRKRK